MTAVASPPSFPNISRPGWGINGGQSLDAMDPEERGERPTFAFRKPLQRTNSSSSVSSTSSTGSSSTLVSTSSGLSNGAPPSAAGDLNGWIGGAALRKRPQPKTQWQSGKSEAQADFARMQQQGRQQMVGGLNGAPPLQRGSGGFMQSFLGAPQAQGGSQGATARPLVEPSTGGQPVLYLLSLNGTFERKTISVPFSPDTLRIGRQTNVKTVPTPTNGFFDSKVLSRQHAEIWADRQGKIWIRDVKSSNGTFVNGTRLSAENRESEPHELQTSDHLELGIDIVSEDQKSVVHHKVAAKVEHAGFLSPSNSLLDMSFGDLDPANGAMMMPQMGGVPMQLRGRTGSQSSIGSNQRMAIAPNMANQPGGIGIALQRGLWLTQPSTEAIVKRLHQEMRAARLQSQDLARTNQFIHTLLSKDELNNEQKPESADGSRAPMVNGNAVSFRADPKARFSDPPAPPPQQPLPEKPDMTRPPHASDVPSLKRGATERPKSQTSPIRPDDLQFQQLAEELDMARRELNTRHVQLKDLEQQLQREQEARKSAEELARRLEDAVAATAIRPTADPVAPWEGPYLENAFDPPIELPSMDPDPPAEPDAEAPSEEGTGPDLAAAAQARIDSMVTELQGLKQQVEEYQQRAETAEAERDADRVTLAEMVLQIRQRDEEDARKKRRSRSRGDKKATAAASAPRDLSLNAQFKDLAANGPAQLAEGPSDEQPTLSRANTITPSHQQLAKHPPDSPVLQGVPYASMLGVVLIGMGLMAYLNGWQQQPRIPQ